MPVSVTTTHALAMPVPRRSAICGQNPWAQNEARVTSTHSHNPASRRLRTWAGRCANIASRAPSR